MQRLTPGTRLRHFKGGLYVFQAYGTHTETNEAMAAYTSADGRLWVRPLDSFEGTVECQGRLVQRFEVDGS